MNILSSHNGPINALQFDHKNIVTGSDDATIKVWNMEVGQCINTLHAQKFPVRCLQFFEFALTSGGDNIVRMWDTRTGSCCRQLFGHTAPITTLQFDEYNLISGSLDETIRIWDLRTGTCQKTLLMHHPVNSLCFNSQYLVVGTEEKNIRVFNTSRFQHLKNLTGNSDAVNSVKIFGSTVVSGGKDNSIHLWYLDK